MRTSQQITVQSERFVDPQGRQVLLHGINMVNKNANAGYLGDEGPELFAAMADWGSNCVRLGVIWDGLEPEPGVYDEGYLQGLDRQIAWAGEYSLNVFLDMHQDLYSVCFSDGAPEWATLTGGQPHVRARSLAPRQEVPPDHGSDQPEADRNLEEALDGSPDRAEQGQQANDDNHRCQGWIAGSCLRG